MADLGWIWPFVADRTDAELAEMVEAINATIRQRALKDSKAKFDVSTKEGFAFFVAEVAKQSSQTLKATVEQMEANIFAVTDYTLKMQVIRKELRSRADWEGRIPWVRKAWKDRTLYDDCDASA